MQYGYVKYLIICLVTVLSSVVSMAESSDVSNITVYQEGSNILIEYDLEKDNEITPYVSVDGGEYVKLTNVSGDVGARVAAGHKRVIWNVLGQYELFVFSEVKFKIEAGCATVTDICGNVYSVVKIGEQYWMAENMRCNQYDTLSEACSIGIYVIPKSNVAIYTPYYTDASNRNTKFGYLYNWAAAVGVENGYDYGTYPFYGYRQGVCPNRWHIPSSEEWNSLNKYLEADDAAGSKLKASYGWNQNGNGSDYYGFEALPSGCADGSRIGQMGEQADFWSATPIEYNAYFANYRSLIYDNSYLYNYGGSRKDKGLSVRCIKD